MAYSIVAQGNFDQQGAGSITVPGSIADGDLAFVAMAKDDNAHGYWSAEAGFTVLQAIDDGGGGDQSQLICYRWLDGTESGTWTFGWQGDVNEHAGGAWYVLRGLAAGSDPLMPRGNISANDATPEVPAFVLGGKKGTLLAEDTFGMVAWDRFYLNRSGASVSTHGRALHYPDDGSIVWTAGTGTWFVGDDNNYMTRTKSGDDSITADVGEDVTLIADLYWHQEAGSRSPGVAIRSDEAGTFGAIRRKGGGDEWELIWFSSGTYQGTVSLGTSTGSASIADTRCRIGVKIEGDDVTVFFPDGEYPDLSAYTMTGSMKTAIGDGSGHTAHGFFAWEAYSAKFYSAHFVTISTATGDLDGRTLDTEDVEAGGWVESSGDWTYDEGEGWAKESTLANGGYRAVVDLATENHVVETVVKSDAGAANYGWHGCTIRSTSADADYYHVKPKSLPASRLEVSGYDGDTGNDDFAVDEIITVTAAAHGDDVWGRVVAGPLRSFIMQMGMIGADSGYSASQDHAGIVDQSSYDGVEFWRFRAWASEVAAEGDVILKFAWNIGTAQAVTGWDTGVDDSEEFGDETTSRAPHGSLAIEVVGSSQTESTASTITVATDNATDEHGRFACWFPAAETASAVSAVVGPGTFALADVAPGVTLDALSVAAGPGLFSAGSVAPGVTLSALSVAAGPGTFGLVDVAPGISLSALSVAVGPGLFAAASGVVDVVAAHLVAIGPGLFALADVAPGVTLGVLSTAIGPGLVALADVAPGVGLSPLSVALGSGPVSVAPGVLDVTLGALTTALIPGGATLAGPAIGVTLGAASVAVGPGRFALGTSIWDVPIAVLVAVGPGLFALGDVAPGVTLDALSVATGPGLFSAVSPGPDIGLGALSVAVGPGSFSVVTPGLVAAPSGWAIPVGPATFVLVPSVDVDALLDALSVAVGPGLLSVGATSWVVVRGAFASAGNVGIVGEVAGGIGGSLRTGSVRGTIAGDVDGRSLGGSAR